MTTENMTIFRILFELFMSYGMAGLFAISVISSIIPIPTEPVVFGLLRVGKNPEMILTTLAIGSIIGASVGYLVGRYGLRKLIPFQDIEKEKQMQMYFRRYGALLLIASPWIPFVGDLAPMIAGIEKYESKRFVIVISAAKIIKSIGLVYFSMRLIHWWTLLAK